MKFKLAIVSILVIITCDRIDKEIANSCNPAFIFKEEDKALVNFDVIGDFVFQPYCSPCHSTSTYQNQSITPRLGYLPLDDRLKIELASNQQFLAEFEKYINHDNPKESLLVKSIQEGNVLRPGYNQNIDYREPRFNCYLPKDFANGLIWWIENANGNTQNMFR